MRLFAPVLGGLVLLFVVVGTVQFLSLLPGGERGLLEFERVCRLHTLAG